MKRLLLLLPLLTSSFALASGEGAVPVPVALMGRLHFPLLHFPLVLLLVVVLVELIASKKLEKEKTKELSVLLLTITAATSVITVLAGLAYAQGEDFSGASRNTFLLHRAVGIGVAVASVLLLLLRKQAELHSAFKPLLLVTALAVVVTGHWGGELVHGDGFYLRPLRADAEKGGTGGGEDGPSFSYDDSDGDGAARARHPEGAIPEKPDYEKDIKPIFVRSCVKCHGPEKRKGGLRLDEKRFAMKGGESGVVLVPGDAEKSLVYTMSGKPADDEDVMPPKGKLLSLSEIETLKRWIDQGANWPEKETSPK